MAVRLAQGASDANDDVYQNPQMAVQAQDRAHRIGETRPVLIFRLVSRHTIESKILQRASEKRQVDVLVITKGEPCFPYTHNSVSCNSPPPGKVKAPIDSSAKAETRQTIAEMVA